MFFFWRGITVFNKCYPFKVFSLPFKLAGIILSFEVLNIRIFNVMKNSEISSKSLLIIIFSTFQSSSGMPGSTTCQYHFKLINSLAMAGAKYLQSKTRYKHDNQRHPVSKWILEYFLLKPKINSTASQHYLYNVCRWIIFCMLVKLLTYNFIQTQQHTISHHTFFTNIRTPNISPLKIVIFDQKFFFPKIDTFSD